MRRAVLLSTVLCSLLAMESMSRAEIPPILRPGTHAMWAAMGLGGALCVGNSVSGFNNVGCYDGQFKLIEQFGIHFTTGFGGPAGGPAAAIDLQEGFGGSFTTFAIVPKFLWDILIVQNLGLYLTPSLGIGYNYSSGGNGLHSATIQIGFEGKLILGDRGFVFFRPITIDVIPGSKDGVSYTSVRWDLLFGGGVIF